MSPLLCSHLFFFVPLLHTCHRSAIYYHDLCVVLSSQVSSPHLTLYSFHSLAHPICRTLVTTCVPRSPKFIFTAHLPPPHTHVIDIFISCVSQRQLNPSVSKTSSFFIVSILVKGICIHLSCTVWKTMNYSWYFLLPHLPYSKNINLVDFLLPKSLSNPSSSLYLWYYLSPVCHNLYRNYHSSPLT